jgi:hypothetical protein
MGSGENVTGTKKKKTKTKPFCIGSLPAGQFTLFVD